MLPSGADAAQVLAINLSGSTNQYVLEMNEFAKKIGMTNSNFINITGLDATGQYSTLNDILILLKYSLANDTFKEIFTTKEYTLTNNLEVKSTIKTYQEKYDIDISRIIGSKTGTTNEAGLCLASYFKVKNQDILAITTNAPLNDSQPQNLIDSLKIINYLDENYEVPKQIPTQKKYVEIADNKKAKYNTANTHNSYLFIYLSIFFILLLFITKIIIKRDNFKNLK